MLLDIAPLCTFITVSLPSHWVHPAVQNINPYEDLELYMNWEPNAWNDRPYVVAQGEGMFMHSDKKKWGM